MSKRLLTMLGALSLALVTLVPAAGAAPDEVLTSKVERGEYDAYVVIMRADPLLAEFERSELRTAEARNAADRIRADHDRVLREAGLSDTDRVQSFTTAANGFSALVTHDEAERLAASPDVLRVVPDELLELQTDSTPDFLGLTGRSGAYQSGITGEGVVVGVIDSGIWPEHPSFADDGTYPAPPVTGLPCEFGNTVANPNDAPFTCNNKLIGAVNSTATYRAIIGAAPFEFDSARDDNGHGTHTASTAAGNADVAAEILDTSLGTITGIAPRAHVMAYKGCGALGCFSSDTAAAIDRAAADGVDVINFSIGGGPALLTPTTIAFLFAANAGIHVATSAGNSGPGAGTVGAPGTVPWITTVGANTQSRFFTGRVILGNGDVHEGASITPGTGRRLAGLVDAEDAGDDLCNPGALDPAVVSGNIVLCRRGAIARAAKSQAVFQAGGVGMILYENTDDSNLFTDTHFVPTVHIDNTPGLAIKAYIDSAATARARLQTGAVTTWPSAPSMGIFSSRGPNVAAPDIIKPDITAPGIQILAGMTPMPGPSSISGQLFQAIQGTSMSSPHVAGVYALLKQANPDWSPAAAKSAIMTAASTDVVDNDRVSPADPFEMGAGQVNPGSPVHNGTAFNPGLVYDAGFNEFLGFLCDAAPEAFSDPDALCALLDSLGIPTDASDLNLASIGVAQLAGSQTVTRTVTSVDTRNRRYSVSVDAPDGFDVTVSPSSFTILPGQSVSYEVTITNDGTATIGAWSMGSLTWTDRSGRVKVRSPIAANATALDAPAAVAGSGEDGSASFDVKFGYTGDYTAAAHGLEAANVTSDTVVQDPDQAFDPNDGFSNAHVFSLSGAAHLRFAMPPDAVPSVNHDIDLFLFDPNGALVAASTRAGTNEQIDVALPADGDWTLYVHGWQTVDPTADYDLYTWIVSATPGGSMSVDSAPASATLGATETIDVSWAGATTGELHLGAVSHSDGSGLIGLTLVEVDNR